MNLQITQRLPQCIQRSFENMNYRNFSNCHQCFIRDPFHNTVISVIGSSMQQMVFSILHENSQFYLSYGLKLITVKYLVSVLSYDKRWKNFESKVHWFVSHSKTLFYLQPISSLKRDGYWASHCISMLTGLACGGMVMNIQTGNWSC